MGGGDLESRVRSAFGCLSQIPNKLLDACIDHPKASAVAVGGALGSYLMWYFSQFPAPSDFDLILEHSIPLIIFALSSSYLYEYLDGRKRMKELGLELNLEQIAEKESQTKKGLLKSLWDFPFEHPLVPTMGVMGYFFGRDFVKMLGRILEYSALQADPTYSLMLAKEIDKFWKLSSGLPFIAAFVYFGFHAARPLLHSDNLGFIRTAVKSIIPGIFRRYNALEKAVNEELEKRPSANEYFALAEQNLRHKDAEKMFTNLFKGVNEQRTFPVYGSSLFQHWQWADAIRKCTKDIEKEPLLSRMSIALFSMKLGNQKVAIEQWQKLLKQYPDSPEVYALYAYFLFNLKREKEGHEQLQNAVKLVYGNPSAYKLVPVAGRVYSISSGLFDNIFRFKSGREEDLLKERYATGLFAERMANTRFGKTVTYIGDVFPFNGDYLSAMMLAPGELAATLLKKDLSVLGELVKCLAHTHALMPSNLMTPIDNKGYMATRLSQDSTLPVGIKQRFMENLPGVLAHLDDDGADDVYNRDGHAFQFCMNLKGEITVTSIDLGIRPPCKPWRDFDKLLYMGDHMPADDSGIEILFQQISNYIKTFNDSSGSERRLREGIPAVRAGLSHVPLAALSYHCFGSNNEATRETRLAFIKNGIFAVNLLLNRCSSGIPLSDARAFEAYRENFEWMVDNVYAGPILHS